MKLEYEAHAKSKSEGWRGSNDKKAFEKIGRVFHSQRNGQLTY